MKEKFKAFLAILIIFILSSSSGVKAVFAWEKTSQSSALLAKRAKQSQKDQRVGKLRLFLKSYNSPLFPFARGFILEADKNGIDWRLLPAIAGVESSFGKYIPANSYNAYGWNNGNFYFKSWEEGIKIVSSSLRKYYYDRGADTVFKIAPIYAPPSRTWAGKVSHFMEKIDSFSPLASLNLEVSL